MDESPRSKSPPNLVRQPTPQVGSSSPPKKNISFSKLPLPPRAAKSPRASTDSKSPRANEVRKSPRGSGSKAGSPRSKSPPPSLISGRVSPPTRQLPKLDGSASKISPRRDLPKVDGSPSKGVSPRGSSNIARPLPSSPRKEVGKPKADIFSPTFQVFDKDQDYEDMIKMNELTADSILRNLSIRYAKNKIYTFIGDIVVSVNPYKSLPQLYTQQIMREYSDTSKKGLAPHIFSVASAAFEGMVQKGLNQSILATGESGAGKTEATKLIVNWFSVVGKGQADIYKKMVVTSTVLEAFGNAKTARNHNSSRFGKFFKMLFSSDNAILGGEIETFLLEQARVTRQNQGERNFHIFYQMFAGMPTTDKEKFGLTNVESFRFVNTCTDNDMDDQQEFQKVVESLGVLGIDAHIQETVFSVLVGILWLGQIEFELGTAQKDPKNPMVVLPAPVKISNPIAAQNAAKFLGLDAKNLSENLERRTVQAMGRETFAFVVYTVSEAAEARDTLARGIYSKLFDWIVSKINASIAVNSGQTLKFIGLLDIFGFENFDRNTFDQLLINLGNEKLQFLFVEKIFKLEQEFYKSEGIEWNPVSYPDNSSCLQLLEEIGGILSLLDEECMLALGNDQNFLEKIKLAHKKHPNFDIPVKGQPSEFTIRHYAEDVCYDTNGFRSANLFVMRPELVAVLGRSSNTLVSQFFSSVSSMSADLVVAGKKGGKGKVSVGKQYKIQLADLVHLISTTTAHYVRCIRPNTLQVPDSIENGLVTSQLSALGVLATCQIRQASLPYRFNFVDFYQRYWQVAGCDAYTVSESEAKEACRGVAQKMAEIGDLSKEVQLFAIGTELIYCSHEMYVECEKLRTKMLEDVKRRQREEEERLKIQQEEERKLKEEQDRLQRLKEAEERKRQEAEEAQRRRLAEMQRQKELEELEAKRKLEEEQKRKIEEEEAERQRLEHLRKQEEAEKKRLEEEVRKRQEEEAAERQRQEQLRQEAEEAEKRRLEEEEQKRLQEEEAERQRLEEIERQKELEKQRLEQEERLRKLSEKRRVEEYEEALRRNQSAKGFIRPVPLQMDVEAWKVDVMEVEVRKGKEPKPPRSAQKEAFVRMHVTCGRENWFILKGPVCFTEFHQKLLETLKTKSLSKVVPVMPDFTKTSKTKDIASAIQSLMNFCGSDPQIWNMPLYRQFLLSGLNNVESAGDFMSNPDHAGILVKKKGEKKGLKKKEATRWCVIKRRVLYYYQKKDYDATPKGIIALDGSIVAVVQLLPGGSEASSSQSLPKAVSSKSTSPRKKTVAKSFKLIQNDRTKYLFTCPDEQECAKWVSEIKRGNSEVQAMSQVVEGTLEVELIAGKDLQGSLENGLQNPFLIAYVEGQQVETTQCTGTLNPIWRNSFPPSLEDPDPIPCCFIEDPKSLIWFSVWSKSKKGSAGNTFERFQFLGCAIIPVSSLENGVKFDGWIPLAPRKNKEKVSGCIRVALTYSFVETPKEKTLKLPNIHNLFGVSSLDALTHAKGNTFPVPGIIAQIIAFFVKHKDCATDSEFFQRPYGPEWSSFLQHFEQSLKENGKFEFTDDLSPTSVMGLLYFILRNFQEPLISFAAFNTLFGEQSLQQSAESNAVLTVDIGAVKTALGSLKEENKVLLALLLTMFRMLIDNSPLNVNTRSQTMMYGREYQKKGKAQIRRRVSDGISVSDVIASFGCVIMKPAMETERTVLRLIESNAVLEYIMLNAPSLFGEVDLQGLAQNVENLYKKGGVQVVSDIKSPGQSPSQSPRLKPLPMVEVDEEEDESLDDIGKPPDSMCITSKPLDDVKDVIDDLSLSSSMKHIKPLPIAPPSDSDDDDK